jgi:predicted MFS family arabinose efflux permease
MKNILIRLSLLISYFGDYCSLIGMMELAKRFGQSDKVVSIYTAYCIPPLLMLLIANKWAANQRRPAFQMGLFCLVGVVATLSMLVANHYLHLILVTVVLGFVKESIMLLMNVYIKHTHDSDGIKTALRDIVSIRFFIMVFGGSLGGFLGEINRFDLVFGIDAASYLFAGICFLSLNHISRYSSDHSSSVKINLTFTQELSKKIGLVPFLWIILSTIGIGSFMGLEYPLITTDLGILPRFMGIIYAGHLVGVLVSQRISNRLLSKENLYASLIVLACFLILSFGLVGVFGHSLWLLSAQIGLVAFCMVALEIHVSYWLMHRCSQAEYAHFNLLYRVIYKICLFIGSLLPLFVISGFGLQAINVVLNSFLIVSGVIGSLSCYVLFQKYSGKTYEST